MGEESISQRSNQKAKGNSQHITTTTMLHCSDGVVILPHPTLERDPYRNTTGINFGGKTKRSRL